MSPDCLSLSISLSLCLPLQEEELHENTDLTQPPNTTIPDNLSWIFCEGEKVRVDSDESVAKKLQEESVGAWHDDMTQVNNRLFLHFCSVQHPEQYRTGTINAI